MGLAAESLLSHKMDGDYLLFLTVPQRRRRIAAGCGEGVRLFPKRIRIFGGIAMSAILSPRRSAVLLGVLFVAASATARGDSGSVGHSSYEQEHHMVMRVQGSS
jgi:hypothetical protein